MSSIPEEIIIRNLQNTATEEEVRLLNKWLREDNKNVQLYAQMEEIWNSRNEVKQETIREGWHKLSEEIQETARKRTIPLSPKRPVAALWIRYAAAVIVGALLASGAWFGLQSGKQAEQELLVQNVVYNHTGVQTLLLPDGSEVFINENSKISYPEEFRNRQRLVQLEGKAYFDIRRNTEQPFIVRIGNVHVEVTGTEFFIDSGADNTLSVTLISGSVNVNCTNENGDKSSAKLIPGEEANINTVKGNIKVTHTDTSYHTAWKDGTYRFADEPLEKIVRLVAKRLDLDIQISPSLKTKRFTGRVTPDDTIQDIVATIGKSYPIKYHISGKTIKISE